VIIGLRRMIMRVLVSALFAVAVVILPAHADEREDAYAGVERWSEAFNCGDIEQIVRMYTNDALWGMIVQEERAHHRSSSG
jgi:hypothetical protein